MLRRTVALDARCVARIRLTTAAASGLVRLPFGVLVGRTVAASWSGDPLEVTVRGAALLEWLDGSSAGPPQPDETSWRSGVPPASGWRRVETVPDDVVRGLVRSGALALKEAAEREGVPGAQPRAEVADALLDSIVLTASDGPLRAEVSLRLLSALTRMGFLPRGSHAAVDVAGRWLRVAAEYGSVFGEQPHSGLNLAR